LKEHPELLNPDWHGREKYILEIRIGEALIEIVACKDRFDELVQFVAHLNSDAEHHIGFFGEGEADIRASLAECLISPAEGFTMAYEGNQLVGVFGVDADPEINRAWLFGPLVDHEDWHAIADQLYAKVLPRIPVSIRDYDLFADVQNTRLETFAVRHGFPVNSENAVLSLARENYMPAAKRQAQVIPYQKRFFKRFEALHKTLFPNAYFTARQITEKINEHHRLFLVIEERQLLGYLFGKIEPESGSGYVDFIGTDASRRGRGVGADLLAAGVDWMLSAPAITKVNLTVNADNAPARHLYEKFGFVTDRVMRGYRKRVV
jgi:ribosomal protein S18 acetylase RimI-like enzyme